MSDSEFDIEEAAFDRDAALHSTWEAGQVTTQLVHTFATETTWTGMLGLEFVRESLGYRWIELLFRHIAADYPIPNHLSMLQLVGTCLSRIYVVLPDEQEAAE